MKNKKVSLGKLSSFSHGIRKKGISAIIATVLIILITVAAVTIIWAAIIPMIQNQIGGATECFDASASLLVMTDFSCVAHSECTNTSSACQADETTCGEDGTGSNCNGAWTGVGTISVQVHRGTGNFVLEGINVIIGAAGTTSSTTFTKDSIEGVPDVNGDRVYIIDYTGEKNTEAGVAAIVKSGNTEKTCDKSGMINVPDCA